MVWRVHSTHPRRCKLLSKGENLDLSEKKSRRRRRRSLNIQLLQEIEQSSCETQIFVLKIIKEGSSLVICYSGTKEISSKVLP